MSAWSSPLGRFVTRGGAIVSLCALLALAGCGASGGGASSGGTTSTAATATSAPAATATSTVPANAVAVKITGGAGSFSFSPASVTVPVGGTVVWTNDSGAAHTVTSDTGDAFTWDSSAVSSGGGTFSETFTKAGTFPYHCSFHPSMHGTVIVTG